MSAQMKIALMTYFTVNNTGQFFQAVATLSELQRVFPKAEIELVNIHHERRYGWLPPKNPRCIAPALRRHFNYVRERKTAFGNNLGKKSFKTPSQEEISDYLNQRKFDVVITGADTCLKVDRYWPNTLPPYWIDKSVRSRKFFLAASAEQSSYETLTEHQRNAAHACLSDLDMIFCRDSMTLELCRSIAPNTSPALTHDPSFCVPLPNTTLSSIRPQKKTKPICAVNLAPTPFAKTLIRDLQKQYNVFSLNRPPISSEEPLFVSPSQWLSMWNTIDCIVTSSFHESIFAIRSGTPLVALDTRKERASNAFQNSKVGDLMERFSLDEIHYSLPSEDDIPKIINTLDSHSKELIHSEKTQKSLQSATDDFRNSLNQIRAAITY